MPRSRARIALVALLAGVPASYPAEPPPLAVARVDVATFHPVEGPSSGPAVYYRIVDEPEGAVLRGLYHPGMKSVTMGIEVPEELRQRARRVRWSWRARVFPVGGDECRPDRGDSAASVSLAFKRGLKWYVLKYVWSTEAPLGAVCDQKRNLLLARDTIVLERDGLANRWLPEVVDVRRAFVDHFAGGDPHADVPDLVGIGVMSDGDQTNSESGADWRGFEIIYAPAP